MINNNTNLQLLVHFLFSYFEGGTGEHIYFKWTMDQTNNGSFVLTNENSTSIDAGNSTDSSFDQNSGPSAEHDDTVSVVLIPLVIIGN